MSKLKLCHLWHAAVSVLADASAASMWRPSEGGRCSGRWHGAAIEQHALGACVGSFQGHVISLSTCYLWSEAPFYTLDMGVEKHVTLKVIWLKKGLKSVQIAI